ncbi:MAG: hypothetical protein ACOCNY_03355, partial [Prevotella sp.]
LRAVSHMRPRGLACESRRGRQLQTAGRLMRAAVCLRYSPREIPIFDWSLTTLRHIVAPN